MPLTITKLKMWKDPGYTRQCLDVPPVGSWKLPAADYVSTMNLRPRKNSTLTAVELPLHYLEIMDMSYLYIEVEDGVTPTPNTVKLFGWILSIEETASSNESVLIRWTVDYWRTYSQDARFGKCNIKRCADATYKRPYPVHPRKWTISHMQKFTDPSNDPMWCCVVFNQTVNNQTIINHRCWQMGATMVIGGQTYTGLTLQQVMSGLIDDLFTITPSSIIGVFITPYAPHAGTIQHIGTAWFYEGYGTATTIYNFVAPNTFKTDDMNEAVIVDPYGCIVGRLPYGCETNKMTVVSDVGGGDLRMMLCFDDMNDTGTLGPQAGMLGRVVSLSPLIAPVNSNAWSEYAYTGQREYDKANAELQRNEARIKGYTSAGTSLIGGAVAGSMAGGPLGMAGGMVASTGLAIASNEMNYFLQGKLNDRYQQLTDKLYASQSSNLLIAGGGMGFTSMLGQWAIVQLTADSVSKNEYNADVSINGYETDVPVSDPTAFLTAGGPLQMENLVLTGQIPPEAKTYIKNILENGVRIVENNPTGVNP